MNKALVSGLKSPAPGTKNLHFPSRYSQPFLGQLRACLWKQNLTYWRTPDYNCVRFCFSAVAAVLFGSIFWNLGQKRYKIFHLQHYFNSISKFHKRETRLRQKTLIWLLLIMTLISEWYVCGLVWLQQWIPKIRVQKRLVKI